MKSIAFVGAFALAGCQILLGIDPDDLHDAQHDTVDGSSDATWSDVARPPAKLSCTSGGGLDCECATIADCHPTLESACEAAACIEHKCDVVARDGLACGADGRTCRGYACIGPDALVRANGNTTCLRASDGTVWCWGDGVFGQLGDRGSGPRSTPYLLRGMGNASPAAIDLAVGRGQGCAVLSDHTTMCWGDNSYGETTGVYYPGTPPPVLPNLVADAPPAMAVAAGYAWTCVLAVDGSVSCWGGKATLATIAGVSHATAISGRWMDMCALAEGGLWCWGDDNSGQLGPGLDPLQHLEWSLAPIAIAPLGDVDAGLTFTAVTANLDSVCALAMPGGTVECWGSNRDGQLGNGASDDDSPSNPMPAAVVGTERDGGSLAGMARIFGSTGAHVCATATGDPIFCWGDNRSEELGFGIRDSFPIPVRGPSIAGAVDLALGDNHACILRRETDGYDVSCVGDGTLGQLGDGLPLGEHGQTTPARVHFPEDPGGLAKLRQNQ